MVVLVINNGTVQFHIYVPNDDSDGDGVPNTAGCVPARSARPRSIPITTAIPTPGTRAGPRATAPRG